MKECAYCGRENPDDAKSCPECRVTFSRESGLVHGGKGESPWEYLKKPISAKVKWSAYFGVWIFLIIATAAADYHYLLAAPLFPIGLCSVFPFEKDLVVHAWMQPYLTMPIGWGVYALVTLILSRMKTKGPSLLVYIFFCLLLVMNAVGCQRAIEYAQGIH